MENSKNIFNEYELKKERVKEICASVGKDDTEFVNGTMFGVLVGMSMLAHRISNLQIQTVDGALSEFQEMADILHNAMSNVKQE